MLIGAARAAEQVVAGGPGKVIIRCISGGSEAAPVRPAGGTQDDILSD